MRAIQVALLALVVSAVPLHSQTADSLSLYFPVGARLRLRPTNPPGPFAVFEGVVRGRDQAGCLLLEMDTTVTPGLGMVGLVPAGLERTDMLRLPAGSTWELVAVEAYARARVECIRVQGPPCSPS
jgi:hypothetical protein